MRLYKNLRITIIMNEHAEIYTLFQGFFMQSSQNLKIKLHDEEIDLAKY